MKLLLPKILDKALLSCEELKTVLYEIEFVRNSRTLIYVREDDLQNALTPFHLFYSRNFIEKIYRTSEMLSITKRYHYNQKLNTSRLHKAFLNKLRQHDIYCNISSREKYFTIYWGHSISLS